MLGLTTVGPTLSSEVKTSLLPLTGILLHALMPEFGKGLAGAVSWPFGKADAEGHLGTWPWGRDMGPSVTGFQLAGLALDFKSKPWT